MLDNVEIRAMRLAGEVWNEIDDAKTFRLPNIFYRRGAEQIQYIVIPLWRILAISEA